MKRKGLLFLGLGLFLLVQTGEICWSQTTERVSVDTNGSDGDNASNNPTTSSNGRYVAFQSGATDLVPGGSNGFIHIFVRDRQTGTTTQVSVDSNGDEADDGPSSDPSISADGRHVTFESDAGSLVAGDMPPPMGFPDIFVRDRDVDGNGTYDEAGGVSTVRVSVDSDGTAWDGPSLHPSISAHGRYVAFDSDAGLVADDTLIAVDVFVHDRDADGDGIYDDENGILDPGEVSTVRVSVDSAGTEADQNSSAPSISANGRYVAFESLASNLVPGGSNGFIHIFVHDRDADGDGIYDDENGILDPGEVSTVRVSLDSVGIQGDGDSNSASISADGRYVAFESIATNLVAGDTNTSADIFVHDRQTGTTTRVSVDSAGNEGNGVSRSPSISDDGRYVTFYSEADNLVANDSNGNADVFVHDRDTDEDGIYDEAGATSTVRVSVDSAGSEGNGDSKFPSLAAGGTYLAFQSAGDNLVPSDNNGFVDIFVHQLQQETGQSGGSGDEDGNSGCFIATAAEGFGMTGEK